MNILFACHRFPYPPNRGGKIRPFHMIQHLSQRHSVWVASLAHTAEELDAGQDLKKFCAGILAEVLPSSARWRQACLALPTALPSSVAYFRSKRLLHQVEKTSRSVRFDLVMAHCAFAAQYVVDVPAGRRVLDFGDLDSTKWFDYTDYRPPPLSWGYHFEAKKLRLYERRLAERFDRCTVTTSGELEEFRKLDVATPCRVIPNGVNSSYFQPVEKDESGPPIIAFLGRMDYFPNVHGILHFARNIFPLIRQRVPEAELHIIGASPAPEVKRLARLSGITVTGFVPDVRPLVQKACVGIAPLRIARGTQNKVLEFMAMGVPVVATPEVARGIQAVPGRDLLVASDESSFAASVIQLIEDPSLRTSLRVSARRQVESVHAWPLSMAELDSVLFDSHPSASAGPKPAQSSLVEQT